MQCTYIVALRRVRISTVFVKELKNIKLDHDSVAQIRYCVHSTPVAIYREVSPHAAPQSYEIKSCRIALCTSFISRYQPPGNRGTPGQIHVTIAKN